MGITLYSAYSKFPEDTIRQMTPVSKFSVEQDPATGTTKYVLRPQQYVITLTRMLDVEIATHLAGFAGFIRTIYSDSPDRRGQAIIDQIHRSKLILGVIIEPPGADRNLPLQVINAVATMTKSIQFINGSLIDRNDKLILAPNGKFDRDALIDPNQTPKPWYKFW